MYSPQAMMGQPAGKEAPAHRDARAAADSPAPREPPAQPAHRGAPELAAISDLRGALVSILFTTHGHTHIRVNKPIMSHTI